MLAARATPTNLPIGPKTRSRHGQTFHHGGLETDFRFGSILLLSKCRGSDLKVLNLLCGSPSWTIIELSSLFRMVLRGHLQRRDFRYPDLSYAETATKELNAHSIGLVFPRLGRVVKTRHLEMVARAALPV